MLGETVPHGALEQDTVQVTPPFFTSFATAAMTWAVAAGSTLVGSAETLRLTGIFGGIVGALLVTSPPQAVRATHSSGRSRSERWQRILEVFILISPQVLRARMELSRLPPFDGLGC
jgi:hypothetical protein